MKKYLSKNFKSSLKLLKKNKKIKKLNVGKRNILLANVFDRFERKYFRYAVIGVIFALVCVIFTARIIILQNTEPLPEGTAPLNVRTVNIKAVRGEVYDRNGNKLISNSYTYDIYLDAGNFPTTSAEKNALLTELENIIPQTVRSWFPVKGTYPDMQFDLPTDTTSTRYRSFVKMMNKFGLTADTDCQTLIELLIKRYGLKNDEGIIVYPNELIIPIISRRYDLERAEFSELNPYTIAQNVSQTTYTAVLESGLKGVAVEKNVTRVYNYPGYASHILGRTGKIPAEDIDYYTELGYPMDAIVGIDGVEKAFENYLRGQDGVLVVVEDSQGNRIDEYYKKEPVAGYDVYLTLDIDLQITAETALADNIASIKQQAEKTIQDAKDQYTAPNGELYPWAEIPSLIGEDVCAGAATLISPKTGEIYALASNPTFDLTTFSQNYSSLLQAPNQPLYNRALLGTYEPGSTFKVSIAAAALEYGIIEANTRIYDSGKYTYYDDYQPECWVYTRYGFGHGYVNAITALQNSCNYYFYDVGRRLTIQKMNEYCSSLGLGQSTGIELPESTGILAGPGYKDSIGQTWVPGDTIQAAIGQSDNTFTPLQIASYLSAVVNQGTRYSVHLLHSIKEFGSGKTVYEYQTTVQSQANMSEETLQTVKLGMKNVIENGTAAPEFVNYPMVIGGKTGTAQVGKTKSFNGIFMAFAPYDEPEVVVACVIEQAHNSNYLSSTVKALFNKYFNITE